MDNEEILEAMEIPCPVSEKSAKMRHKISMCSKDIG